VPAQANNDAYAGACILEMTVFVGLQGSVLFIGVGKLNALALRQCKVGGLAKMPLRRLRGDFEGFPGDDSEIEEQE
jgi:hypothetical protein